MQSLTPLPSKALEQLRGQQQLILQIMHLAAIAVQKHSLSTRALSQVPGGFSPRLGKGLAACCGGSCPD